MASRKTEGHKEETDAVDDDVPNLVSSDFKIFFCFTSYEIKYGNSGFENFYIPLKTAENFFTESFYFPRSFESKMIEMQITVSNFTFRSRGEAVKILISSRHEGFS